MALIYANFILWPLSHGSIPNGPSILSLWMDVADSSAHDVTHPRSHLSSARLCQVSGESRKSGIDSEGVICTGQTLHRPREPWSVVTALNSCSPPPAPLSLLPWWARSLLPIGSFIPVELPCAGGGVIFAVASIALSYLEWQNLTFRLKLNWNWNVGIEIKFQFRYWNVSLQVLTDGCNIFSVYYSTQSIRPQDIQYDI